MFVYVGATNRPQDLDKAIQRRMPATFRINLPDRTQRNKILKLILRHEPVAVDVDTERIAAQTENLSGSDLFELCRNASVYRVRDFIAQSNHSPLQVSIKFIYPLIYHSNYIPNNTYLGFYLYHAFFFLECLVFVAKYYSL